jgi:hypothetical protein
MDSMPRAYHVTAPFCRSLWHNVPRETFRPADSSGAPEEKQRMEATEQQQILEEVRAINAKLDRIVGPPAESGAPAPGGQLEAAVGLLRAIAGRLGVSLAF